MKTENKCVICGKAQPIKDRRICKDCAECSPYWISGERECSECKTKMDVKQMILIYQPNGDYGWYCSYRCAKEEMDSEMFMNGERHAEHCDCPQCGDGQNQRYSKIKVEMKHDNPIITDCIEFVDEKHESYKTKVKINDKLIKIKEIYYIEVE